MFATIETVTAVASESRAPRAADPRSLRQHTPCAPERRCAPRLLRRGKNWIVDKSPRRLADALDPCSAQSCDMTPSCAQSRVHHETRRARVTRAVARRAPRNDVMLSLPQDFWSSVCVQMYTCEESPRRKIAGMALRICRMTWRPPDARVARELTRLEPITARQAAYLTPGFPEVPRAAASAAQRPTAQGNGPTKATVPPQPLLSRPLPSLVLSRPPTRVSLSQVWFFSCLFFHLEESFVYCITTLIVMRGGVLRLVEHGTPEDVW